MRRRSFFLLEVLIAVILIGGFAYLSIHGAFQMIHKQRKLLREISESMEADNSRMDAIAHFWKDVDKIEENGETYNNFKVKKKVAEEGKFYLLEIEDKSRKETFSYFVTKHAL